MTESRHLSTWIDRPARDVYAYVANPANLPSWAAGLSGSIEEIDGRWVAESPMGRVQVAFVADNPFGVVDHDVTVPSGETFTNPMRVIAAGDDACEVVFTLRRQPAMTDEAFEADAGAIVADLATLKRLLEAG